MTTRRKKKVGLILGLDIRFILEMLTIAIRNETIGIRKCPKINFNKIYIHIDNGEFSRPI